MTAVTHSGNTIFKTCADIPNAGDLLKRIL